MADFGIAMDGRAPITSIPDQARAAAEGGASTLWIACHLFLRDPVTTAALALGATKRLKIALMALSPYTTHPVYIAMAAASLAEMYPGRVTLCLGAGAPADLKAAGIEAARPLVTIGEAVKVCRSLFAGEMADFHGKVFNVSGRRLANAPCDVPIVIAASRPNMLQLAGRETDGVLISAATSPPFVKACLDQAAEGSAGKPFRKLGIVYTRLGATEKEGIDPIRRPIGFVLRGAHHAENIRLGGATLDQAALASAYASENWAEVDRLVSDDVVRRHAACGTPAQVKARLEEYRAIGLDEVIIGGMDDASSIAAALAAARG
ncbi:5,10-methylenetetrahydromethanopterin reductase [Enhydrobacter aerosaccus]|uniref:5,10-methylenetetrahydromethanopterin reductase n=1 Tax=Enhydrobacter aerosaccus TaxID=225324 RepID=A0A1T4P159_9HYPH|nr:LLM class flavin-dependent oxidoreductase [Enhydrobacter aerosaccus]SJZ85132.1 5,10-methylenetetrahydromethanopterin reductase [Enhydrobacter aerosaccus]